MTLGAFWSRAWSSACARWLGHKCIGHEHMRRGVDGWGRAQTRGTRRGLISWPQVRVLVLVRTQTRKVRTLGKGRGRVGQGTGG
jgi:hypothetical protein